MSARGRLGAAALRSGPRGLLSVVPLPWERGAGPGDAGAGPGVAEAGVGHRARPKGAEGRDPHGYGHGPGGRGGLEPRAGSCGGGVGGCGLCAARMRGWEQASGGPFPFFNRGGFVCVCLYKGGAGRT